MYYSLKKGPELFLSGSKHSPWGDAQYPKLNHTF